MFFKHIDFPMTHVTDNSPKMAKLVCFLGCHVSKFIKGMSLMCLDMFGRN